MRRLLLIALIAALAVGCDKQTSKKPELQENTEAYFAAHGIVQEQVNELRIGGTQFRFPAGVGLNPYSYQETYRSKDGSPMTLSTKEGMEQGKYEKVATPIVKGRADKVTFYLDPSRDYAPNSNPYGGGVRVEITKFGAPAYPDSFERAIRDKPVIVEHPEFGLREYRSEKNWIGSIYETLPSQSQQAADGGKLFFGCQPSALPMGGLCGASYWKEGGKYSVSIAMDGPFFLEHWQEAYPSVIRFVDFVVAK